MRRVKIKITGTVQGVGFRPTVYRYAIELGLVGSVANTSEGVFIEAQGPKSVLERFVALLQNSPPPLARIDDFLLEDIPTVIGEDRFRIVESLALGEKNVEISPDIATCSDCQKEIFDPKNRRYQYPFTNCTNCGPRFTIIKDRPYDRALTAMSDFPMCPKCLSEYENPLDRRFHAQPNACEICGPKLYLIDAEGDPLKRTIELLKQGKIAGIKGLGGFNIACDPFNLETMKRLREAKRRPHRSFALMMNDLKEIRKYCQVSSEEEKMLLSKIAPIVLLKKLDEKLDHLSPDNNYLGVMLPYTPLHHLLLQEMKVLVMTSANLADGPMSISDSDMEFLIDRGVSDFALSHNREIIHRADDSIVQFINNKMHILRRSRGFVPQFIKLEQAEFKTQLALGANMKNTFALQKGEKVYLSQHIGELLDRRNYDYQKEMILSFTKLLEATPERTFCDSHPGYENYQADYDKIQHHHAHMLSVMAEHQLLGKRCFGVIADGTGYGDDGTVWGFEFLLIEGRPQEFKRVGHLEDFYLPGGELAFKEIDRVAISLLEQTHHSSELFYPRERVFKIKSLWEKKINSPLCSSLGRLFDGVASLLNLLDECEYEARSAILLQKEAENFSGHISRPYHVETLLIEGKILSLKPLIEGILSDLNDNKSKAEIAYKFHLWIVDAILLMGQAYEKDIWILSGGCFQNALLIELLIKKLHEKKVTYYFNEQVPSNDGGLALGQIVY